MILRIRSYNPDLRRKGRILAIMLSSMTAATFALTIVNIVQGDTQYNAENIVFISFLLGLLVLNRFGFVRTAGLFTVVLSIAASFSVSNTSTAYMAMVIPILIASSLLAPWSGFIVAALIIIYYLASGTASLALFILAIVTAFSYLFADSLERAYRENRHRALHDELTDLPNRTLFIDLLQQAIDRSDREQKLRAVLFMDLDEFKIVNDSLGHEAGDELLIEVARRLQNCLRRSGETAARLGGDEFTVLLDDIAEVGDAVRVAERIARALEAPIELRGRQVVVSTSIGIALSPEGDGRPNTLLRNADVAMYEAKREGKASYKVFNSDMYARALKRLELENELRRAIQRGELKTYYQPKVLLSTGGIAGMEALARWKHPERGLVYPEEFIPLAEETGLIVPLGRWMMLETCRQAYEWRKRYPTVPLITSVNLSVKQFKAPGLVQDLREILQETGLDPRCLQLEITESMVADDVDYAVGLLQKLKGLGVKLAMDDFGTGYSSLASLQRFPLDDLKVDKAFVHKLGRSAQDEAIVRLVVDLAHALGVRAVAEGVETDEQATRLRGMGCDQGQGFYFWKPLPSEAATELLADPTQQRILEQGALTEHSWDPVVSPEDRCYFGLE